jgi:amino acid adenylation domain-containing protein
MLTRELAQQFGRAMPNTVLLNLYGSTEVSADVTCCDMRAVTTDNAIPIGRPIANTRIYILDSDMQPLPIGVPGEIYVGGEGLARGYLNRPERTATQFVSDPFSEDQGSRLYRTGDLGRYLADGNIEFRGRLDHQVKIRGCRVELGEVEAALNRHPAVKESVIVAHAHDSFEINLVGYFVTQQDPPPSTVELRGYLKEKLPAYMVPSLFVGLASLPLTPSGKVDRNALPWPDAHRLAPSQAWLEPRTDIEELVAQVWRKLLRLDKIGVFENFFDLGGHSLLATRAAARLGAAFGIDLPLRKLFEFPTVAGLAAQIERLCRERNGISVAPIAPASRNCPLPLSFSQRRLWFIEKLDPGLTAYNISAAFRITGTLDIPVLERAINEIIKRHETLRTRIIEIDGQPFQEIVSDMSFSLPVVELSGLAADVVTKEIAAHAAEDGRRPYDFGSAPLMRVKVLRFAESDHALIVNFHHAICDGSSLVILYQELQTFYGALLESKPSPLDPLAIQYGDYAVWQETWLGSEAADSQLAYWKRQLADWSALNLPTDYSRGLVRNYGGAREAVLLSEKLTQALKELSREQGVTPFMTLLAAFNILLSRHSGQQDIVIGSTIAGRARHEIDDVIGFFINAIVLRGDLSGNPKFTELLQRIREMCLGAYTHQDLPFEKLVEEMDPPRDFNRNPIFDVLFNMADVSRRTFSLAGCQVAKVSRPEFSAMFDVVLHAPEVNGRIELAVVYNAALFSGERINILLRQFELVLSQVAEEPQKTISQFSLALPAEGWDLPDPAKPLDDGWEGAIHEVCAERARITPGALAAIDSDDMWTYSELDQRSSQLANYLIANRSRHEDVVAIFGHRGCSVLVALLGVLKAGGAFLIIDPAYPPARLTAYLRIARPKAWIQMAAAGRLSEELTAYLESVNLSCRLTLPREKQAIADELQEYSGNAMPISIDASDLAYIAFTSGSSGEPKAVLARHGPMTHFLPWQKEAFGLDERDRFCLLSGLAYNHLHRDIFTALYLGATLYIPPPEIARDPVALTDWLRANEISVLHLTPALGHLLLSAAAGPLPSVRRIFFGGDVLTRGEVMRIRELAPNATIGCFYGATETQRAVGYYEIPQDFTTSESDLGRPVPLGRGIKDVQLLLLNRSGGLAGVGELAEIYIRSPHLAAGYIGDETATRRVFVINPFTGDRNDRLYRSGELGRYLPDGNVQWVGRTDRRVSLRGFRVELEEIEAALKKHPAVKDAAVVLREMDEDLSGNPESKIKNPKSEVNLVAYLTADESGESTADLLHGYLSMQLPEYMVPAHFIILEQLPLSPSGKIDYRGLPSLASVQSRAPRPDRAPRNAIEEKLSVIFREVLERNDIDIEDNFFRLGGHSLLAARAAARIREAFGIGLELRSFLDSPTVAGLARQIGVRINPTDTTSGTEDTNREEIEL